jgi:hypothetical protein
MLECHGINVTARYRVKLPHNIAYEHVFIELSVAFFNNEDMPFIDGHARVLFPFHHLFQILEFIAGAYYIGRMPLGSSGYSIPIECLGDIEVFSFFIFRGYIFK